MKNYLILQVLRKPSVVAQFSFMDWDLLIRQARSAGLMARIYFILDVNECLDGIPEKVLNHFISDWLVYEKQHFSVRREVFEVHKALKGKNLSFCLMKGAAYIMSGLTVAKGRVFSDIDLMVSAEKINETEQVLMNNGWMGTHHDEYDRKYYREWMHEIPPLCHVQRQTVLDVHHNILPLTARNKVDAKKIIEKRSNINGTDFFVLCKEDLVLHSATHLFHEGEFSHGLRDVSDLDSLLKEFSSDSNFWLSLLKRSDELNLGRQLFYAIQYTTKILHTPVPVQVIDALHKNAPNAFMIFLLDFLFIRALMPDHASCNSRWTGIARFLLFVRSHWLRMPLHLLLPHLARKSWMRMAGNGHS